jgi:UDP-glucuronate 4-epimerase
VHLAARAGVRPSIKDPVLYEQTNILGTLNLLELARDNKTSNFVFGSSSSVYGKNKNIPFCENDRTDNPISPYAATKKAGEVLCHTYHYLYNLNITCLRFFTVYGPRGRPDMAPYLFTDKIYRGEPITMFGDGKSKRDYTYIKDIVSGILAAVDANHSFEIINLGNSQTVELKKFINIIEELLKKKAVINQEEMPKGDVPVTYADLSKANKLLQYSPQTDIKQGMREFISWYMNKVVG